MMADMFDNVGRRYSAAELLRGVKGNRVLKTGFAKKQKDKAVFVDQELDPFPLEFVGGETVQLGSNGQTYLCLSSDDLRVIADWIDQREAAEYGA